MGREVVSGGTIVVVASDHAHKKGFIHYNFLPAAFFFRSANAVTRRDFMRW